MIDLVTIVAGIVQIADFNATNLILGRFMMGFVMAMNTSIIPTYIREFSP
jgi:hypothetical protein